MKKIFIFFTILLTSFSIYASSSFGRIGIRADYAAYFATGGEILDAQEAILSISGANFFDKNNMFGIGYSVGYGFSFNDLEYFKPIHITTSALFSFDITNWLAIEPKIGISDIIYVFDNIVSNEFGFSVGCGLEFTPIKKLGLSVFIDYTLPMISSYRNSISTVAFEKSILSCGIAINYLY